MVAASPPFAPARPDADVTRSGDTMLAPGTRVGRYVVEGLLGAGAMGVVFRGRDPELGRAVALKCVRLDDRDRRAQDRLRSEARAMAQLSDPNVVAVHDLVEQDGRLTIAMELVDGTSLKTWLATEDRGWRAIVEAFIQAGRGLAAAHEAGLVHRDFKPENVLRTRRGRVCVADFGLACSSGRSEGGEDAGGLEWRSGERWATSREIAGTPDYMAPEQARGGPADARSDQFSFCVALYEALYGDDPLRSRVSSPADPREPDAVPSRIRKALLRGLQASPEERHASMDALLDELASGAAAAAGRRDARYTNPDVVSAWLRGASSVAPKRPAHPRAGP